MSDPRAADLPRSAFVALACALPLALFALHAGLGHQGDLTFFHRWYLALRESSAFYAEGPGLNYPILGVLLVTAPACLVELLTGEVLDLATFVRAHKATLVLAEIALVLTAAWLARSLGARRPRALALALYALPSTWAGGAWFGQIDVWGTVFLLASAAALVDYRREGRARSLALGLAALHAALLTKQLTWLALPALVVLSALGLRAHGSRRAIALALASPAVWLLADPFLTLPDGHISHLLFLASGPGAGHGDLAVASGASVWSLIVPGDTPSADLRWLGLTSRAWGWIAFALAQALAVRALFARPIPDRHLVAWAGVSQLAMALLLTGVHERYLVHAVPLLVLADEMADGPRWRRALGWLVGACSGLFVLSTIHPDALRLLSRPEPLALAQLVWLTAWLRRPCEAIDRTSRLGRLALVGVSSALALALAELVLRAGGVAPERWASPRYLESADKRAGLDCYPDDRRGYFPLDLRDAETRSAYRQQGLFVDTTYERTPHAVALRYSAELCRGGDVGARIGPRVVVMGDSFTEGQGVREEHTSAALLDARLDAEVINCGRRGYDFPALAAMFERHLALEPDLVVYAMLLNDPVRSEAFSARQRYIDDWIVDRRRAVTSGDGAPPAWTPRLVALATDRLEGIRVGVETTRWYREMVEAPNREGWMATLDHLSAMHAAMRARGGELLVVLWPLLVELDSYPFERAHSIIGQALRERSIPFHDALPAFRGQDPEALWVHPSDRHPNERAHALFARAIEPAVRRALSR